MKSITITLDLPPRILSPNGRGHWATKARAVKKYRRAAAMLAREAGVVRFTKARMDLAFYVRTPAGLRRDRDNCVASMKAGADGLADAGLVANDRDFEVGGVTVQVDKARPRVEVTLTEISEQEAPGE